jgi:hypothetical protein
MGTVKVAWLSLLFLPVLPLRVYVVAPGEVGYTRFFYETSVWSFVRVYRWRVLPYLLTVVIESLARALLVISIALVVMLGVAAIFGRL